jgi:hypothetical protein
VPDLLVAAVLVAAVLLVAAGLGRAAVRRLRGAYTRLRDEARQAIGAQARLAQLRQAAWEVEQARDAARLSGPVAARLLEHLRRLGDEIAARDRPF